MLAEVLKVELQFYQDLQIHLRQEMFQKLLARFLEHTIQDLQHLKLHLLSHSPLERLSMISFTLSQLMMANMQINYTRFLSLTSKLRQMTPIDMVLLLYRSETGMTQIKQFK